jgi:hypothetical protein
MWINLLTTQEFGIPHVDNYGDEHSPSRIIAKSPVRGMTLATKNKEQLLLLPIFILG